MNKTFRLLLANTVLIAAGAAAVASASAAEVVVIAPSAPPPVRYEAVPAPRVGYVWDHGHWRWDHGRYVWIGGSLASRARRLSLGAGPLGRARPELSLGSKATGRNATG